MRCSLQQTAQTCHAANYAAGQHRRLLPRRPPPPTAGRLNAHVNAHFALNAAARYVNDNFDKTKLNSRFEKNKVSGAHSPPRRRYLPRVRALPIFARAHGVS